MRTNFSGWVRRDLDRDLIARIAAATPHDAVMHAVTEPGKSTRAWVVLRGHVLVEVSRPTVVGAVEACLDWRREVVA